VGDEGGDVALLEAQPAPLQGMGFLQHGGRAVDAEGLGGAEVFVEPGGQLAGAAAEVDDALRAPALRRRVEQRQEVVERAGTLGAELPVLGGVPGVGCAHPPLVPGQAASVAAVASASP